MITFAAFLAWFCEFSLASWGAFRSYRKLLSLFVYLAFRACADVALVLILHYKPAFYGWANWAQKGIQYAILCFVAAQMCALASGYKNRSKVVLYASGLAVLGGKFAVAVFARGDTPADKILDTALAAQMILLVGIFLAGAEKRLPAEWRVVFYGMLTALASNVAVTMASKYWLGALYLMPVGELIALGMFLYAPSKIKTEFRACLGYRAEPTEVIKTRVC